MNLNDRVYEKLSAEYDAFIESVKAMSGEEAIKHAYEKVFKEDIVLCFEGGDMQLSPKQAKALLAEKKPLDYLYNTWLDTDCSYMDMLRDSIDGGIECLEKDFNPRSGDAR